MQHSFASSPEPNSARSRRTYNRPGGVNRYYEAAHWLPDLQKKVQTTYWRTEKGKKVKEPLRHNASQTWVDVPPRLRFVDGQDEAGSKQSIDGSDDNDECDSTVDERSSAVHNAVSDTHIQRKIPEGAAANGNLTPRPETTDWISIKGSSQQRNSDQIVLDTLDQGSTADLRTKSGQCGRMRPSLWQFQSAREAFLFSHYIKRMSPSIDVLDGSRSFGKEVPRRAASQPLIASAIYAVASLHLALLNGTVDVESPSYLDASLQQLKQILDKPLGYDDETLLAGIVLLRTYEEMSPQDDTIHILGGERLLSSIASYSANGGLEEAASWILLRQHIYIALTTQSPLRLNLALYQHAGVLTHDSDEAWANRAVFLFACIINLAYGVRPIVETNSDTASWNELDRQVEAWYRSKPWYFSPLWPAKSRAADHTWPEIVVSEPAHAVGLQYYSLCKLILFAHWPGSDNKRPGYHKPHNSSKDVVLSHVRTIVGLAVSNPEVTNLLFEASHILAVYGSLLNVSTDQIAAIDFLQEVRRTTGWPTDGTIKRLQKHWEAADDRIESVRGEEEQETR